MTVVANDAANDRVRPQPIPIVSTDIRAETPKASGLPSRKIMLSAALLLGAGVVFAVLQGFSEPPRQVQPKHAQVEPHAVSVPDVVKSAPDTYEAAGFTGATETVAPPVDRFWGANGPPPGFKQHQPPAAEVAGAAPPAHPAVVDPAVKERDSARGSPILFGGRRPDVAASIAGQASMAEPSIHAARLAPPASRTILQAGSIIPAALQTGLNSDVPGRVVALVTAPVHDSLTGSHVLIPQGSRLIGAYQDAVSYGDRRIRIVWTRLILPNGWSMDLAGLEASDVSGAAGLPAMVDDHLDRVAVASVLSGALSTAANAAQDRESAAFAQSVGDAAAQEAARVGGRIIDRELSVRPTLRAPAGAPVRVLVTRDLVLKEYRP